MLLEGPAHYHYQRNGGRAVASVAWSERDAEAQVRAVFPPGERVTIHWPTTSHGSAYAYAYVVPERD